MSQKETRQGMFEAFSKMGETSFSIEGAKKAAAWYLDTTERVATQALELQEKATGWAKETPLASLFEAQQSIARKFVERSLTAARSLWQIEA
jgi:Phasin protein